MEYIGFILSPDGLTMDSTKIQVIQDWLEPCKVQDIQSFLGFTNFYQWFIYNYSDIVIPLIHLTQKGTLWHFSDDCQNAFTAIKKAFTCAPVITHWVLDAQITVEMDTPDYTDDGTSTQKGGIATMPPLTPTISILSSPKSNWHCPLEQQYFFLQYSKPCPWWTSNNFTLTSALPYPLTPLHPFTSSPRNLTHDGPWTPMVFSEEIIISMC